jgi:predicted TIM-barrel fold metal-dependent hydrolase
MPLIDAHVHLYPPEINRDPAGWAVAHGEPEWARLTTRVRRNGRPVQGFPSVDDLLREMDRAGVDRSVLLGWYWIQPENCARQNRFYADCIRAHPDRLAAFATVQPGAGAVAVEAELTAARAAGLSGVGELSPHAQRHALDAPGLHRALELAGEWGWAVNLHATDPNTRDYPGRVETPLADFVALARAHPATTLVLAHWGGLLPLREASVADLPNLWYDTAASPLTYDATVWARVLAVVPAERVVFGSDFPLNLYPTLDAEPALTRFVAEARSAGAPDAVMHGNAARLLNRW